MRPKQKEEINRYIGEPQDFTHEFWQNPMNVKIYMRSMTAGLDPDDADRYAVLCGLLGKDIYIEAFQEVNFTLNCQSFDIFDLEKDTEEWDVVINVLQTLGIEPEEDKQEETVWDTLVG